MLDYIFDAKWWLFFVKNRKTNRVHYCHSSMYNNLINTSYTVTFSIKCRWVLIVRIIFFLNNIKCKDLQNICVFIIVKQLNVCFPNKCEFVSVVNIVMVYDILKALFWVSIWSIYLVNYVLLLPNLMLLMTDGYCLQLLQLFQCIHPDNHYDTLH